MWGITDCQTSDGAGVDDTAGLLLLHDARGMLDPEKYTLQQHVQSNVVVLFRGLVYGTQRTAKPCVIEHTIEAAVPPYRLIDRTGYVCLMRDVHTHECAPDLGCQLHTLLFLQIRNYDPGTARPKQAYTRSSDAAGATGDQRDLSVQITLWLCLWLSHPLSPVYPPARILPYNPPMSDPNTTSSGEKFRTGEGVSAIKDGQKPNANRLRPSERKPPWLRVRLGGGARFEAVRDTVHTHRLSTVCQESHCPNMGECWSNGTATIMLMGSVCTRACRFCAVDTGNPKGWLDPNEPTAAARSVALMQLQYVVLTSVDRDDLSDGGAAHYAACVQAIKKCNPGTAVEALTPDFSGDLRAVEAVVDSGLDVFAQNLETVDHLTHRVRDPRAGYRQTLNVLRHARQHRDDIVTKSSLMLGLGETAEDIQRAMNDLREQRVDILTLGQYLRPTLNHLPVERWVHPDEFAAYRDLGLGLGFIEVASGPLVRSSYRADRILEQNNLGLGDIPVKTLP